MEIITSVLEKFGKERSDLIKALQSIQKEIGYVSDNAIENVAKHFNVAPIDVEGVVSFYTQFKRVKPGKFQIAVCDGTACHIKGSSLITGWIKEAIGIDTGETDSEGLFSLDEVACLGCCSLAPVISINNKVFGNLDRKSLKKILTEYKKKGSGQ